MPSRPRDQRARAARPRAARPSLHDGRHEERDPTKRALSGMLPPTARSGDEALAEVLFEAFVAASEDEADTLTHGFHSYPARLHPAIASVLLDRLVEPVRPNSRDEPARVVDPFCGSGTVLIEARIRGLYSWGVDLNPIALRVAEVKTDARTPEARERFAAHLARVVEASKERVREKAEARAPLTREEAARFEPHVLRELAGLHKEIGAVEDEADRRALFVTLSAILVKVSKQRSETARHAKGDDPRQQGRRIGRFIPSEMFEKKGHELLERWAALHDAAVERTGEAGPAPRLSLDDARALPRVLTKPADLIITSPPYAGTYDYAEHHALRAPWLGVSLERIQKDELGARRSLVHTGAVERWDAQVLDVLRAVQGALAPAGLAIFVVGDGEIGGTRVPADAQLARLAPSARLRVVATASAPRTDWRGGKERREHLVALAPA